MGSYLTFTGVKIRIKKKKESELWAITFCLGQSLGMLKFDLGG